MAHSPTLIEKIVGKFVETLVIYSLLGVVAVVASASLLTGHFPPSKEQTLSQIEKIKDLMGRSQQIIDGIKATNDKVAEIGPQFEVIGNKIGEVDQRVQVLEAELKALKAIRR